MTSGLRGRSALVVCVLAGAVGGARGATTIETQVSPAGMEAWSSTLTASPGSSFDVRVRISYVGDATPMGLAATVFQPIVSNWLGTDAFTPLVNGGAGGQKTTPIGAVVDAPGQYGRIIPFAAVALSTNLALIGHVNTVAGTSYLRVAQRQVTNWMGLSGNTSGGSGVNILQLSNSGRTAADPAFSPALTDIVVFKFNCTLSSSEGASRDLSVTVPLEGIFRSAATPFPHVSWYMSMDEATGSLRELPAIMGATVHVPGPGTAVGVVLGGLAGVRRRRR